MSNRTILESGIDGNDFIVLIKNGKRVFGCFKKQLKVAFF